MLYDAKKWDVPIVAPAKKLKGWQKVLLGAADLIEQKGWITGALEKPYGYCTVGAIIFTKGNWFSKWLAMQHLKKDPAIGRFGSIIWWNDTNWGNTKTTVVETLRKAAYGLGRPPH